LGGWMLHYIQNKPLAAWLVDLMPWLLQHRV
jgi:hypothetical protein